MKIKTQADPETVARRAHWLAYQASRPVGMGFLHERSGASEADVQAGVMRAEYKDEQTYHSDYLLGRMVKLNVRVMGGEIDVSDVPPRGDYQSWAHKYPTYAELIAAAEASLDSAAAEKGARGG